MPILTNCALAGLVPWNEVRRCRSSWLACRNRGIASRGCRSSAMRFPRLVAIGQARYLSSHRRGIRSLADRALAQRSSRACECFSEMQPASGGYLEATPLTSFVVMSLAGDRPRRSSGDPARACDFLLDSVRPDGSWPIDTNLATWVTTLAINALGRGGERTSIRTTLLDWLLSAASTAATSFHRRRAGRLGLEGSERRGARRGRHAGGAAGAGRMFARKPVTTPPRRSSQAADAGIDWLLGLQNRDGGWPTFCRGWGTLPFDRSGTDLTAHAFGLCAYATLASPGGDNSSARCRISAAICGFRYLAKQQRPRRILAAAVVRQSASAGR